MGNAAASAGGRDRSCCGIDGLDPHAYVRAGERPEREVNGGETGGPVDEETQPGLVGAGARSLPTPSDDLHAPEGPGAPSPRVAAEGDDEVPSALARLLGTGMVFGSSARAHRPSVVFGTNAASNSAAAAAAEAETSTPGNPAELGTPARARAAKAGAGGPRMMRDGERGVLGAGACQMLEQPLELQDGVGPRTRYVRVGTPRDGSCFFHAVLASLNLDMRLALAPGRNRLNDEQFGRPSERSRAYRNLDSAGRAKATAEWRQHLARRVTEPWFRRNLHTGGHGKADEASVFCPARNRQIGMKEYVRDYADPEMYVGDSVWPHVAEQAGVNILVVVQSDHDGADAGGLPRVYGAAKYNSDLMTVCLLLIDRGGSRGHYESLQTVEGVGCFRHFDPLPQLCLERQRLQNSPVTPK